jgi:plastocyanin
VPLKGIIKLPANPAVLYPMKALGYWLLPNEVLGVLPPLVDPRTEMVVVLEGRELIGATLVRPVVRLEDARFNPSLLPVAPHTRVTFENKDPSPHQLAPLGNKVLAPQRLGPKQSVVQVFDTPGDYHFQCTDVPHMRGTVLVTGAPVFVQPDPTGAFAFPDIRPGDYTLRVWYREKWIHSQPVPVKPNKTVEVQLQSIPGKE